MPKTLNHNTSFFSDVRSFFDGEYGGRHLAIALKALARHDAYAFRRVLRRAEAKSHLSASGAAVLHALAQTHSETAIVDLEHLYGKAINAKSLLLERADLALTDERERKILFEIKDTDYKALRNRAQLFKYVRWCRRNDVPLIHVSRYPLEGGDRETLLENQDVLVSLGFADIYEALEPVRVRPLARMLCEYLEELGVIRYQVIDLGRRSRDYAALKYWTRRFIDVKLSKAGRVRTDNSIAAFSSHVDRLFGNLEVFGSRICAANSDVIRQRFSRDFGRARDLYGANNAELARIKKWASTLDKKVTKLATASRKDKSYDKLLLQMGEALRHAPDNRYAYFQAYARLHPKNTKLTGESRLFVWLEYYLQKKAKGDIEIGLGAGIECVSQGIDESDYVDYGRRFPGEETAWKQIKTILLRAQTRALKKMSGSQRVALKRFALE